MKHYDIIARMDNFIKSKSMKSVLSSISLLLLILSVFFVVKVINEIKSSRYVGNSSQYPDMIYVSGKGEVTAVPDIATLSFTITKDAATAKDAQNLLNEDVTKVLEYVTTQGVEDKDVKSEYGGLSPKYSYERVVCITYPCPSKEPKIVGYTATQSISVKVREVDNSNVIRTGLADLGVTDINGPTFSIDDADVYTEQARAEAIKDARAKAEVLAKDLGIKLGKIVNFSENNGRVYPEYYDMAASSKVMMSSAGAAPELPKGEKTITSEVTITYQIK